MTRRTLRLLAVFAVAVVSSAIVLTGCGGGGGGGGGGGSSGALIGVSFVGFSTAPSVSGPNVGIPLPTVFIDESIEFRFDGPIDTTTFGGLYSVGGVPQEFVGVSANPQAGIPYYAFANQTQARGSFEIRDNNAPPGGLLLNAYIVGRHRDKPDTLVIDPKVSNVNPFGLPFNAGYIASTEYTYRIPPTSSLMIAGNQVLPVGINPLLYPILLPIFSPSPSLSLVFLSGTATGPDPVPPSVTSIVAQSGNAGTAGNPILVVDPIIVTFSKPIDPTSLDLLSNLTIRRSVPPNSSVLVPGTLLVNPVQPNVATFTPTPGYGPGPYNIEVRVGSFGNPAIPPILGVRQGVAATQLPLSNSLNRTFLTQACPGLPATCPGNVTVVETFDTTGQRDTTFTPQFNAAAWASTQNPGSFCNVPIGGSPLASFAGGLLGTRVQRVLNTTFPGTIGAVGPAGLFSPFDDNGVNNLPTINPGGGSHIMHLYEAADLGTPRDSLELIEWGPVNSFVQATTYPNYYAWAGITTITGPLTCPTGVAGMSSVYSQNYNIVPPQTVDPLNPTNPPLSCPFPPTVPPTVPGGVRLNGPVPYPAGPGFTTYFPFPLFSPAFDYLGSGVGGGSLIFEQNISPGPQLANFNRYRAAAIAPVRRLIGAPKTLTPTCNSGTPNSAAAGCDTYDMRFTFVGIVASARSSFYDSTVLPPTLPTYINFTLSPSPQNQPANTRALWELEGATAISGPNTPSGGTTGFLTYWNGTPAGGSFFPEVLSSQTPGAITLSGRRYFRFRATLRNDNINNGRQCYNSFIMAMTF